MLAHKALPQRALVTLLRAFDDPAAILGASRCAACTATCLRRRRSRARTGRDRKRSTRRRAGSTIRRITLVAWDDADYPRALLDIGHAPPVLFFIGRRELLNQPAFAIVGSRHATPQGKANAREFAQRACRRPA